ncbi:MAG: hypothetical protein ACTSRI_13320 [Promethearchaeota archaeon]
MNELELTQIDITNLDIFINPYDLRRDIHVFMDYVSKRVVKRSYNTNVLNKADTKRLAKLMTYPSLLEEIEKNSQSNWVNYIDWLVLKLGFVDYDIKGIYKGYYSTKCSYPDNYIEFNEENYNYFLELTLIEQERLILKTLTEFYNYDNNEFLITSVLGRLDHFSSTGCGTGVLPTLNFAKVRQFLLDILKRCKKGVWYDILSLVQYLKVNYHYFLIPKEPCFKSKWETKKDRYGNFYEGKKDQYRETKISVHDHDAFERVEGRYVERFLESIPLVLNYIDLAYGSSIYKKRTPSLNQLKAFKVNERFLHFMRGEINPPKVTVQPNFEIHIESEFYPAKIISQIRPITIFISSDTVTIMKLDNKKVITLLAKDDSLDVITLLQDLSNRDLPKNVLIELQEWTHKLETFTLYEGFGLLEIEKDKNLPVSEEFTVKKITPNIRIMRSTETLFSLLEEAELIPLLVKHPKKSLRPLPEKASSLFTKDSHIPAKQKEQLTLKRESTVTLHFPSITFLKKFHKAMFQARCSVLVDQSNLIITFPARIRNQVDLLLESMKKNYIIQIDDIN